MDQQILDNNDSKNNNENNNNSTDNDNKNASRRKWGKHQKVSLYQLKQKLCVNKWKILIVICNMKQ